MEVTREGPSTDDHVNLVFASDESHIGGGPARRSRNRENEYRRRPRDIPHSTALISYIVPEVEHALRASYVLRSNGQE